MNLLNLITSSIPQPFLSVLLTALVTLVGFLLRPKVKIIWGEKNKFIHILRPKKAGDAEVAVHIVHYVIQNTGKIGAKEVEAVLNFPPDEISIWPQRKWTQDKNSENRLIIKFEFMAPREIIEMVVLTIGRDLPALLNVKSPENTGKPVTFSYHRVLSKFIYWTMIALMFFGAVFVVEGVLAAISGYSK
ncbi:MAG TPA: hypothetical protein VIJ49_00030 [Aestuariivirga sp.]